MKPIKQDIRDDNDIKFIIETFCNKVQLDIVLSKNTNDCKKDNAKDVSFEKQVPLPIKKNHFNRWVTLFNQNVDDFFEGNIAEEIKLRAESVAYIFLQYKLEINHFNK